jgi:hypothetical protein
MCSRVNFQKAFCNLRSYHIRERRRSRRGARTVSTQTPVAMMMETEVGLINVWTCIRVGLYASVCVHAPPSFLHTARIHGVSRLHRTAKAFGATGSKQVKCAVGSKRSCACDDEKNTKRAVPALLTRMAMWHALEDMHNLLGSEQLCNTPARSSVSERAQHFP